MIVHTTYPQRVIIGAGAFGSLTAELSGQVFLIATGSAKAPADRLAAELGDRLAARWDRPAAHTPVEVTADAEALLTRHTADVIAAIGGGSAIGLAKALSARTGLPQVAVPTTYAGSEVTGVLGETEGGVKTTRRDPALVPGTVVYDPELTLSMPAGLTLTSAVNALAHAVEALWAPDANAFTDGLATEAARAVPAELPAALDNDLGARGRLQEAAWLAGICLASTRMGLHHQLAHALGGTFGLPHAELHTMLLPHVMAFNLPYAPRAAQRLPGTDVVRSLAGSYDGPRTLRDLGVPRDGLAAVAERVVAKPYPNPRPLTLGDVTALLDEAWTGLS
jgi:alcohol dehydrogenase class IV